MKNIQAQYRDLLEGKMSKANFMVNVRRDFPQWISPVNSFTDAVNILKSKRILSEGIHDKNIFSASHTNVKTPPKGVGDYDPKAAAASLAKLKNFGPKPNKSSWIDAKSIADEIKKQDANLEGENAVITAAFNIVASKYLLIDKLPREQAQRAAAMLLGGRDTAYPNFPEELYNAYMDGGYDPELANMGRYTTESHKGNEDWMNSFSDELDNKNLPPEVEAKASKAIKLLGPAGLIDLYGMLQFPYNVDAFLGDVDEIIQQKSGQLNEAEKKEPTIDQVDYIQLQKGTEFELSKMPVISDENYAKAKEKAYKNLVKDSNAYRHLSVANYKDVKKKDKALETQDVKKDNLADKANEQKTLVKNAKPNTKDNLGKQEKAKKGVPEGVKQLREAMLDEFAVVPEIQRTFAKGHQVKTPDGKTGTIEELSQDNTATVKFDDNTVQDYQTNVLKPSGEKVIAQHQGAEVKKSFEGKKMSMEELKEKLMGAVEETMYRDPKTKKVYTAGDQSGEQSLKRAIPGVQKIPGSENVTGS